MKTKLSIATALCFLLPSVSFAATLTQTQVSAVIGLLEAFGVSAQTIAIVHADLEPQSSTPAASTVAPNVCYGTAFPACNVGYTFVCPDSGIGYCASDTTSSNSSNTISSTFDNTTYSPVSVSNYSADPGAYENQPVLITGLRDTFLPATGAAGSTNYISIENPFDPSQPTVMLQVANQALYAAAVNVLQNLSSPILGFVNVYGWGTPDQEFTQTSLFGGTTNVMEPTVNAVSIDQCLHGSMNTTISNSDFDSNFTCTDWMPLGI